MFFTNSDGGARGNPGPAAIGFLIREGDRIIEQHAKILEKSTTNNVAEYHALIAALHLAQTYTTAELTCILDSELVVKQLQGEYAVRAPELQPLFSEVTKLAAHFSHVTYLHVRRTDPYQVMGDALLNDALDSKSF